MRGVVACTTLLAAVACSPGEDSTGPVDIDSPELAGAARSARVIGGPAAIPVRTVDGHPVVDLSGVQPPDPRASVVVLTLEAAPPAR